MFLDSRIERIAGGVKFYEQDILLNDYLFIGDMVIELTVDYHVAGFGIVLLDASAKTAIASQSGYLFKIGNNDFTVIKKTYNKLATLLHTSAPISPPITGARLTFVKQGGIVKLLSGNETIGKITLPNDLAKYHVGLYSAGGNTAKYVSFATGVPQNWLVNVKNTNGGRVFFFRDGFTVQECEHDAELEQEEIFLSKGTYLLSFDAKEGGNIKPYVFFSNDKRLDDDDKNLLSPDYTFVLENDAKVNVKFKGTFGTIKQIAIKKNAYEDYVSTIDSATTIDGSEIVIKTSGVKEVRWRGRITAVPQAPLTEASTYAVFASGASSFTIEQLEISKERTYEYTYKVNERALLINDDEFEKEIVVATNEESVTIFKNLSGVIDRLVIVYANGETFDVLMQKTYKCYVPAEINGPIIVVDANGEPFDLSASFRKLIMDGKTKHIFTNTEREIFDGAERFLTLAKAQLKDGVKVYGITKDAKIKPENLYAIKAGCADDIMLYADKYEVILQDKYEINYDTNTIELSPILDGLYCQYVVDYIKNDSYSVNYTELGSYEVDIASDKDEIYIMYDDGVSGTYKTTTIKSGDRSKFIVLRTI